jgi:hypothetical protein
LNKTAVLLVTLCGSLSAASLQLYTPAVGVLPEGGGSPSFAYFAGPGGGTVETAPSGSAAYTVLNTGADSNLHAGYFNRQLAVDLANPSVITPGAFVNAGFPSLDPTLGFTLHFTTEVFAETHSSADRAGLSVILLGNDGKGIELGFQNNTIFAQNQTPLFTAGESATGAGVAALLQALTNYDLTISGGSYSLATNGSILLSGATRDYSSASGFGTDVYRSTNFVFLGDDTSSASATTYLGAISIDAATVPEPVGFLLCSPVLGLLTVLSARRRRAA